MGSIYKRKDNGRYRLQIRYKILPRKYSFHFDSYKEALRVCKDFDILNKSKKVEAMKVLLKNLIDADLSNTSVKLTHITNKPR